MTASPTQPANATGSPEPPHADGSALREKLEWLMLFRLILVTLLLGSAVAVNINEAKSFSDPSYVGIVALIIGTYAATLGYVAWMRANWSLAALVSVQLIGDGLMISGLVLLTNGLDSIFTFLFFLTIFNGAVLNGRRGSVFAASIASVGIVANAVLQFAASPLLLPLFPDLADGAGRVPVYALLIHLVAFYTVAFLSGYLAEKLGQVGSELERRQLDLKELRALNDDIIRSVDSGLIALDRNDRIIFANEAAERVLGIPLRQMSFQRLVEHAPRLMGAVERLKIRDERYREDLSLAWPDGTSRFVALSLSPLRNANGDPSGWILLLEDLTTLRTLKDEIARQQHLASLGNLAAGIAHEIRNPLAAISGSIEMLRMNPGVTDDDRDLMDIAIREVDRLNALIKEFLDYARPRSINLRPTEVNPLIDEIVRLFRQDHEIAQGVQFAVEHGNTAGLRADIDPDRMRQVVWNLLRNACQAQGRAGVVTIRTSARRAQGREESVSIAIEDQGTGLPTHVLDKIFEPFFTTKSDGTGLGLATSQRIVAEHGGTLRAENLPQGGARFLISLPMAGRSLAASDLTNSGELPVEASLSAAPQGNP